jgi:gluconolactonase
MHHFFKPPYLVFITLIFVHAGAHAQQHVATKTDTSHLVAPGATLQRLSNQFQFTEGPAVDKQGNIYFTDQPNDAIWKWNTDGTIVRFMHGAGRANGLYIDQEGNIIACADEKNRLLQITPQKKIHVLYKAPKRRRLNGPNDLWIDAQGGMYITDPYYQRPYWKRKKSVQKGQYVYYLSHGKKKLVTVDTSLKQPNGIVGTPDGKHLYIADIGDWKTYRYDIAADGTLQNRQLFVAQGSDGLTLDEQGNVYLTGDGVTVYNEAGQQIEHITVPAKWTANLCFGGSNKNQLFITASEAVYLLQMQVKGVE